MIWTTFLDGLRHARQIKRLVNFSWIKKKTSLQLCKNVSFKNVIQISYKITKLINETTSKQPNQLAENYIIYLRLRLKDSSATLRNILHILEDILKLKFWLLGNIAETFPCSVGSLNRLQKKQEPRICFREN